MMKNCFQSCNLNTIHDFFLAIVTFFPRSQISDVSFIRIPNIFLVAQTHVLTFISCFYIMCFVKKKIVYQVGHPAFFLSLFRCFGIARNLFTIFSIYSSSECVLCLLYDLFCDEPTSVYINFLLQFSFSEVSITSGLFSSKVNPCCNFWKYCFHFVIAIFDFLYIFVPIGKSIV